MLRRRFPWFVMLLACTLVFTWWQLRAPYRAAQRALAAGGAGYSAAQLAEWAQRIPMPALWEVAGQVSREEQHPLQARAFWLRADAEGMLSAEGYGRLGDLFAEAGYPQRAEAFWRRALDAGAESPWRLRLAQMAVTRRDWMTALEMYRALAQTEAAYACQTGQLLAVLQPEAALPYLSQAVAGDLPCKPLAQALQESLLLGDVATAPAYTLTLVGRALGRFDEWGLAAEAFRRAVAADSSYAEAWAFLGQAQERIGEDGRAALETALHLAPDSLAASSLMAVYWRAHHEPGKALVYFYRAAQAEPQNPVWEMEIGATLADMGNLPEAVRHYQQAAQRKPDSPAGWRALAEFCLRYNIALQETALPAARQAALLAPNEAASREVLARLYLRIGDLSTARRFARWALQLDAGYVAAYYDLGVIATLQGDGEQARRMLNAVIELAPDSPWAVQAQRLLGP